MSNRITPSAPGSISGVQPVAASRASVSRSTISRSRPTSSATRRAEVVAVLGRAAGLGRDQARARDAAVLHLVAADAQRLDRARDRAASLNRPEVDTPSPSRMMRENASTTRKPVAGRPRDQKPAIVGAEVERRVGRRRRDRRTPPSRGGSRWATADPRCRRRGADRAQGRGSRCPGPRRSSQCLSCRARARRLGAAA